MATISGSVLFNTTNSAPTTGTGVSGVPIVLRDSSGNGVVVLTNASGAYTINNVPNGTYTLVEAWGTTGGVVSPVDFGSATAIAAPTPADPPITSMPSPPAQANLSQSLSPNTRNLNVTGDLTNQNFVDGPVRDIPITKLDVTSIGSNLITAAANGTWGSWPAGTAQGTAPATSPYAANVPGFTYTLPSTNSPGDGQYSILNMSNYNTFNAWYNTSDHTTRDETGRYFLAGASGSAVMFQQQVSVIKSTYYLFSGWVMNPISLVGTFLPTQLTIKITGGSGTVLYEQSLLSIPNQSVLPIWNESATLFNTSTETIVNFQMLSTGAVGSGNDYIVDDLVIQEANVNTIVTSQKTVDKSYADVGDVLTYTVVLRNTGQSTATNIVFDDTIPSGTVFKTGSVTINNVLFGALNPTPPGFTLTSPSQMTAGQVVTINFSVTVNTIPSPNPIPNTARTSYIFTPIAGGATVAQTVLSNTTTTTVSRAEISTTKSRDLGFVTLGDILTYTIPINNFGTTLANNVVLRDTIPNGTVLVPDSVTINSVTQTGASPQPPTGITVGTIAAGTITTVSFKVRVTSVPTPNPIPNTGTVIYNYTIDPSGPRTTSASSNTNIVTSQFNAAILSNTKATSKTYANVGDTITYTVTIANTGNVSAANIIFVDTIPNDTSFVSGSVKINGTTQASLNPNPPGFIIPSPASPINANAIITITYDVKVNTIPSPNPIPNSATTTATFTIDPTTTPIRTTVTSVNSNIVNTTVNNANLGNITKSVDKAYATCGDILIYTITIPNVGNTAAFNVVLRDTIPNGTSLVANSVTVNSVTQPAGTNPQTGVTVGTIASGSIATVTFQVKVNC